MVTDKFGSGSFAQHALIDGETKFNMKSAFKAFKQNYAVWVDVIVVIIAKDVTDLGFLAEELPEVTAILCYFHVIDYLKREISKRAYGFTSFEKTHIKNLITMMVRTTDERNFNRHLQAIVVQWQAAFLRILGGKFVGLQAVVVCIPAREYPSVG